MSLALAPGLAFQNDLRDGVLRRVRHREVRLGRTEFFENFKHLPGEDQIGRAALARQNLNVLPTDSATPTRLQRFQSRFFCSEPRGIMLR